MSVPTPPLSLYVHLPWCVRKCPYCDFNSYAAGADAPRERYIAALVADLAVEAERARGRPLVSVFLGGGTPSLFSAGEIAAVLDAVAASFSLDREVEITLEANPGTVECGSLAGYRQAGVNRLSVGAQSFDAARLAVLGRIHAVDDIARTVAGAQDAGLDNINIDLMYALPDQGSRDAIEDIDRAAALDPSHISWYQLTLEPNTVFFARPPDGLPDDDGIAEIQEAGEARLADLGYERYEVSAYARDGQRCRHNLNYWSFGDYIGVGAGAHGKLSTGSAVIRSVKKANPRDYMNAALESRAGEPDRVLSDEDLLFEFMLNALRLTEGFDAQLFTARTGLPAAILGRRFEKLRERGLLDEVSDNRWQPTPLGQRFLNELQAHFLPE